MAAWLSEMCSSLHTCYLGGCEGIWSIITLRKFCRTSVSTSLSSSMKSSMEHERLIGWLACQGIFQGDLEPLRRKFALVAVKWQYKSLFAYECWDALCGDTPWGPPGSLWGAPQWQLGLFARITLALNPACYAYKSLFIFTLPAQNEKQALFLSSICWAAGDFKCCRPDPDLCRSRRMREEWAGWGLSVLSAWLGCCSRAELIQWLVAAVSLCLSLCILWIFSLSGVDISSVIVNWIVSCTQDYLYSLKPTGFLSSTPLHPRICVLGWWKTSHSLCCSRLENHPCVKSCSVFTSSEAIITLFP